MEIGSDNGVIVDGGIIAMTIVEHIVVRIDDRPIAAYDYRIEMEGIGKSADYIELIIGWCRLGFARRRPRFHTVRLVGIDVRA